MKNKRKGLQAELDYCIKMVEKKHPSPHWEIRVKEITQQLKKGNKNGKGKIRQRSPVQSTGK